MPNTSLGTPYVSSSDYVSNYPTVSQNLANAIDALPRGLVACKNSTTLNQTISSSTATTITGMSLTFTAVASRAYRVSFMLPYGQRPASGRLTILIVNGATFLQQGYLDANVALPMPWNLTRILTFSAGSQTITAQAAIDVGSPSGTLLAGGGVVQLSVEDMGSAGTIA